MARQEATQTRTNGSETAQPDSGRPLAPLFQPGKAMIGWEAERQLVSLIARLPPFLAGRLMRQRVRGCRVIPMDIFSASAKTMRMDGVSWGKHGNPKSVYSRIVGGTFVFLSIWSVFWIGWFSAIPIAAAILWIYVNPRLFPPPQTTDAWATRGVLGERAFINRKLVPIPTEHQRAAWITSSLAIVFLALAIYGFVIEDFWTAVGGWHAATVAKLWFCDRMVWLWDDMKDSNPQYRAWNAGNWDAISN